MLREFAEKQRIPYPLLSDIDSEVIRQYGILNTQVRPGDGPLYGIPYPGVYVTDHAGVVIAKFFHDSYKRRDAAEILIDAALGHVELGHDEPSVRAEDPEIRISATLHGGPIRQGTHRRLVVRFELPEGLHVYGEPVPEGMIPTTVQVTGPEGLVVEPAILPPTERLRLEEMGVDLAVWSGRVDIQVPVYALSTLVSECSPLERRSIPLEIAVRYQACNDQTCLLPRSEILRLDVPLQEVDVPNLAMHAGHGQREGNFDGRPHLRRLMLRKVSKHPLGFLRFIVMSARLELAARLRALRARRREGAKPDRGR